ncbi:hypothetical protein [Alkalibacillus aidingensis]|uniref:hypothetical protein n=1 Tax=Alkalibacillus aidingensis TaxID=2747607 RepID=UPI0016611FA8|nr:hypothetical protein [Alkalibacillus aidingensis]
MHKYRLFNTKDVEELKERIDMYESIFHELNDRDGFQDYFFLKSEVHELKNKMERLERGLNVLQEHQEKQPNQEGRQPKEDSPPKQQAPKNYSSEINDILKMLADVKKELTGVKNQIQTNQVKESDSGDSQSIESFTQSAIQDLNQVNNDSTSISTNTEPKVNKPANQLKQASDFHQLQQLINQSNEVQSIKPQKKQYPKPKTTRQMKHKAKQVEKRPMKHNTNRAFKAQKYTNRQKQHPRAPLNNSQSTLNEQKTEPETPQSTKFENFFKSPFFKRK